MTIESKLRPGQKLAGQWGGEWYPVIVTGFRGEKFVLTAWVQSTTWTSFAMSHERLRLVTDNEFDALTPRYHDTPKPPESVPEDLQIKVGTLLACEVPKFWLPVVVMGSEQDGKIRIHWEGFEDDFDEDVDRDRLFYRSSAKAPSR